MRMKSKEFLLSSDLPTVIVVDSFADDDLGLFCDDLIKKSGSMTRTRSRAVLSATCTENCELPVRKKTVRNFLRALYDFLVIKFFS